MVDAFDVCFGDIAESGPQAQMQDFEIPAGGKLNVRFPVGLENCKSSYHLFVRELSVMHSVHSCCIMFCRTSKFDIHVAPSCATEEISGLFNAHFIVECMNPTLTH